MFEQKRYPFRDETPKRLISKTKGKPLLWINRLGDEAYLVNAIDETLKKVEVSSGGFETTDSGPVTASSAQPIIYHDAQPGEAIRVDEYDGYYDLDYLLQMQLISESPSLGRRELLSEASKGGVTIQALLRESESDDTN